MNDPLGLFGEEEQTNADPLGLFGSEDVPQEKGFLAQQGENMLGLGAALGDMAGGLVKMPLGIGAGIGAKLRGGDGYNTDELRAAAQQEVERLIPSIGKSTGLDKNKTYELAMKPFELIGQGIDWAGNQAGEITGSKDVAGASKLGLDIATLGMGIPGAKLAGKGLARVAEAVDPALRNAGKAKPRSSVDALLDEVKNPPVEQPAQGQLNLFPDEPTGQASPYDAGQAGVTSPITPKRAAAQMELPLRNDLERTYNIDTEGVSIPPEQARVVDLAKDAEVLRMDEQARLQGNEDFLGAKQQEMWATDHPGDLARDGEMAPKSPTPELTRQADWVGEREANRQYTEQRADNGLGGDRPFSRQEFEQIVDNLARESGTKFERPVDMEKAYSDYVEQVNPRNIDMFDIPARKEAWLATAVDNHPAVKAATAKVASIENTISSLEAKVASGEAKATQLIVKQKQLEAAKAKAEAATTNVAGALAKTGRMKKQGGGVNFQAILDLFPKFKGTKVSVPVFHGTTKEIVGDFKTQHGFNPSSNGAYAGDLGTWFSSTGKGTDTFAGARTGVKGGNVHQSYINLQNPKEFATHADFLKWFNEQKSTGATANKIQRSLVKEGFDGISIKESKTDGGGLRSDYVVFRPDQIKSAISPEGAAKNPYNSDIINMHSGIPFTREHWNKLREVGNAMIENAQQAISFAQNVPDVQQNMVQRGINALTKGGSYLKAKVNSPVVHFAVDRLLAAEGAAKSAINERIHGEYLGALRELSKAEYEDAYKILNQADQTQKAITKEAMTRHSISEKVQNAVLKHQELMADVLTQVNAAREAAGKKPITSREGYSAMNMSGDFRKVVYKTVNGVQEVVGVVGANTKTMGKHSLEKLEKLIKDKNPEYEFGPLQDLSSNRNVSKGTPDAAFMDVLQTIGENNPNFAEYLKVLDEVHRDNPSNFLGMQQHALQKKGVWGMEGRKQWLTGSENARDFFENQVRYAESAYQWGEISKAALEISEVLHDPKVLKDHPNASKLAQDYLNNAMGLNPSKFGKAVDAGFDALFGAVGIGASIPKQGLGIAKQVANTAMMSLSPTFLAIQLLQPVASLPGMVMYLRGKGMDSWAIHGSVKAMGTMYKLATNKPLDAIEAGAVEFAKKNHVYATDMVQHSLDTQKGPAYYINKISQGPQAYVETSTRASMFHTLVQTLHDGGLTPKDGLYEQAKQFTDLAMNNYANMEKPAIYNALGPLGSMAYNLKSYPHNEISRWALYAREIPNSGDAKPLLAQMATTIAFAGLMGLPFYSQWEQLYGFITKKLGEPRSLALDTMKLSEDVGKHLGPKGAYALSNGIFSTVGADISSRVGLGDVIPSNAADAAFAGGGKLWEMGKATGRAVLNPSEENLKSAATNLAPPFLQGVAKDSWYTKGDLGYSIDPTNLKPTAKLNDQDKLLGKIGILGINKSVQQTKNYELGQLDKQFQGIRDKAMSTIAQDLYRDRKISQETLDKYFINGQGDPKTFEAEVNSLATKLNLSPTQLAMIRDSASNSITRQRSLMRRVQ